jgi:hypothetical protein
MWDVEFFVDDQGRQPVRAWLQALDPRARASAIAAVETLLMEIGPDICETDHGRLLDGGLFEFRVLLERGELHIFCHECEQRIVLLFAVASDGVQPASMEPHLAAAAENLRSFGLRREREELGKLRRS